MAIGTYVGNSQNTAELMLLLIIAPYLIAVKLDTEIRKYKKINPISILEIVMRHLKLLGQPHFEAKKCPS